MSLPVRPQMTRRQFQHWAQQNVNKPQMPREVYLNRTTAADCDSASMASIADLPMICMCCSTAFYDGYRMPLDAWCDDCLGPQPRYQNVRVWIPKQ